MNLTCVEAFLCGKRILEKKMRIWHQSSTTFLALLEKDIARYFKTNRRLGVDPFQAATEIITAHAKTDPLVSFHFSFISFKTMNWEPLLLLISREKPESVLEHNREAV